MGKINANDNTIKIVGYILAGGESRRFNYESKGLKPLKTSQKVPMIEYVIQRFSPQVDALNINSHFPEYASFGCPIVGDAHTFLGPLSGLYNCMQHMTTYYPSAEWLAIAPCDAPFMPNDMIQLLSSDANNYQAQCFQYGGQLQPTFSIWHRDLFDQLETAVKKHQWGGLKIFLQSLGDTVNVVEYPQQTINPFFNINSEQDRVQAEQILDQLP